MDSAHFRRLSFLLLTITAPHANIAMPTGNPAGTTQDSSADKIHVSVYYCKTCNISVCETSNSKGFVKIGVTQNKTFSNKVIELEINETTINMCFQQENTFYKGIYSIWWQKDVGIGDSCGIVDYGAYSENGSGNIAKICCVAYTNHENPNRSLECYASGEEPAAKKTTVSIIDEEDLGIAKPLLGLEESIGTVTTVLIVGVFAAALLFRRNRNRQGPPMLIQQFFVGAEDKNLVPDIEKDFAPLKQNFS